MKILVVDDNLKDSQLLRQWVADKGAQVEVCYSGVEADSLLTASGTSFNAAFLSCDLLEPPFGLELLARHRKNLPELRFVMMSHTVTFEIAAMAERLGENKFLAKPLDSNDVIAHLNSFCAPGQPETPLMKQLRQTIKGESESLLETLRSVERAINHQKHGVLIIGETGSGKELIAKAIHNFGAPANSKLISVHLSALPPSLVEEELLGHDSGAFTDAKKSRPGLLEAAGNGTLFLDEIGELTEAVQVDLLRILGEKSFRRIGSDVDRKFNGRIICATNRDLAVAVNEGKIRRDFYHRISVLPIHIKPLRERAEDLPILLQHFLEQYRGERKITFARETLQILNTYPFYGNVRELENLVREALVHCDEDKIRPHHFNLKDMVTLFGTSRVSVATSYTPTAPATPASTAPQQPDDHQPTFPDAWLKLPYHDAKENVMQAFNLVYLERKLAEAHGIILQAAKNAKIDRGYFADLLKTAKQFRPRS